MKQAVADQTPTPVHISRRHTDPPFLWISLIFFSFSLHVFVLQLLFGSQSAIISYQESDNFIPIDFVEVPPKPSILPSKSPLDSPESDGEGIDLGIPKTISRNRKRNFRPFIRLKPKPIPRKILPKIRIQPIQKKIIISSKPQPTNSPKPVFIPTPKFTPKPIPNPEFTPKPNPTPKFTPKPIPTPKFTPKPNPTPEFTPKPTPTPKFTPTPIPTPEFTPKPTPIPKFTPTPTPIPTYPKQPGDVSIGKETPLPTFTPTPTTPPVLPKIFTASLQLLPDAEQRQIIAFDAIDKLPQLLGGAKTISVKELEIEPRQFNVILSINNKGNFVDANIPRNEVPTADNNKYQEIVNKIFKNAQFTPGLDKDGIRPQFSQMVVRITIESTNQQP
jgi:hypothetical protein